MLWHQCSANPSYFKIWNQHLKPALHVVALGEVGSQPELYMVLNRLKKVVPPGMFHGGTLVVKEETYPILVALARRIAQGGRPNPLAVPYAALCGNYGPARIRRFFH
jgi:hypothetical protein